MAMKPRLTALALALAGFIGMTCAEAASTTHTLSVSATVSGNCKFSGPGPSTLTIANSGSVIDPSIASDATGTVSIPFKCTKGTNSSITSDNGLHYSGTSKQVAFSTEMMKYALSYAGTDVQLGAGFSSGVGDLNLAVTGTILAADHQNAAAGAYTDTVVLTIHP
jgi:spore coat protein U-like protein